MLDRGAEADFSEVREKQHLLKPHDATYVTEMLLA